MPAWKHRAFLNTLISLLLLASLRKEVQISASNANAVQFLDVTQEAGIDFTHVSGFSAHKYIVEIMGSGCAFLDYDGDGWLDIFLVNGGTVPGSGYAGEIHHALYRNWGNGRFQDVTQRSGIRESKHYGMGVAVGDFDNDGWNDLYLTYFNGPNQLYRNNGNATFTDVTEKARVSGKGGWSTSAAFFDYDNDGFLDLYVARYLDFTYENHRNCTKQGYHIYCSPKDYGGTSHLLFHNNRNGTFTDVSSSSGVASLVGKGLGVIGADLNEDGRPEIYVANDTDPNFLFRNNGDGTFKEIGLLAGVALDDNGRPQSGMGIGCADYDGDGHFDLAVTNLVTEYLALYRNRGDFVFEDVSSQVDLKRASGKYTGFGMGFVDFDNDGDQDIFAANGHISDNVHLYSPGTFFEQPMLLFENKGNQFQEVSSTHGDALSQPRVSRGVAFGDYDNDGDVDILVSNCGGKPVLLRNEGGNRQRWLSIRLRGSKSNRDGIGAVVILETDQGIRKFQVVGGGSYLSSSDLRVYVGLGSQSPIRSLKVRWPSGIVDRLRSIEANQLITVNEGRGLKSQR